MFDIKKYKSIYISEVEDHLQKLNDNLLKLEKKPKEKKTLDELMRSAHTLKGASAMMGYKKMAFLTHIMEDIFDYARHDLLKITPKIINNVFKTLDALENSLASIKKTDQELAALISISARLKKITGVATEGFGKSQRTDSGKPSKVKDSKRRSDLPAGGRTSSVNSRLKVKDKNLKPKIFNLKSNAPESEFIKKPETITHIKVPVERLDNLMDLMEELLIDKMKLERLKKKDPELEGVVNHLSRLVSDFQYQITQARLVPVGQIFVRFPRMVRDLAQEHKKRVELIMSGEELELDRTIIDKLSEPLGHLLRNAIDHGIPVSDRSKAGKEKNGVIHIKAQREKDFALIIVEDNGKGIDFNKIKETAIKRNIINSKEAESYDKTKLISLLYSGQLSTKEKVTETSGRGVGLSIVKDFVDKIGGRVIVESPITEFGGSRFTLELPLTLAIINTLLVQIKDSLFALPFASIEKSVGVPKNNIKSMADQDVAIVGKIEVPLVRLDQLFGLKDKILPQDISLTKINSTNPRTSLEPPFRDKTRKINPSILSAGVPQDAGRPKQPKKQETVVIIKRGRDLAGIVVDKLVDEQEIIIKPLPAILKKTKGFSGSTILGDGKTILILDIMGLLEDTKKLIRTKS